MDREFKIMDFTPLVYKYARRDEDLQSVAWEAVTRAFFKYDAQKNIRLPSYVKSCVTYALWNYKRKQRWIEKHELIFSKDILDSLYEQNSYQKGGGDPTFHSVEKKFLSRKLFAELKKLTRLQRKAIVETVIGKKTLAEVGKELGVTIQAVYRARRRGLENMKRVVSNW